jgi:hypothetical protein
MINIGNEKRIKMVLNRLLVFSNGIAVKENKKIDAKTK